jgi:2-dehydro-3-deoxyphosphogluconate aldolase/(4S)-4-hydroxy-2-oxoglutarate aldolase
MREKVLKAIEKEKIIVIVRNISREKLVPLCEAMYEGGIRLLEVTYDASGKISDKETAENIKRLSERFYGKMYIGAGTVLTTKQVEFTKNAGGKFIISPNTDEAVIKKTRELDMVSMPGALTPTEIQTAHLFGADFVKLFPASNFSPDYVKAVKAPLSHIKLTAVGGIDENNTKDYIKAGVSGFGVGTNITNKKMLAENDYEGIRDLAKKYVDTIKQGEKNE